MYNTPCSLFRAKRTARHASRQSIGWVVRTSLFLTLMLCASCGDNDTPTGQPSPAPLEQITFDGAWYPDVSPNGRWLTYSPAEGIARMSLVGGTVDTLVETGSGPDWHPDGSLILFGQIGQGADMHLGTVNLSDRSVDTLLTLTGWPVLDAVWSPQGTEIASDGVWGLLLVSYPGADTFTYQCDNLTPPYAAEMPSWSPDGEWIAFMGSSGIMKAPRHGGTARVLYEKSDILHPAWSPDGRWIAFSMEDTNGVDYHLWVMDAGGADSGLFRLTRTDTTCRQPQCFDFQPTWAPGSRTVYFTSTRTGRPEIWRIGFQP